MAATDTWLGNTSANWSTSSNWSIGTPVNGSTLFFGAPGTAGATAATAVPGTTLTDDVASLTVGGANTDGIVFGPSAFFYNVNASGGATITLGSTGTGIAFSSQMQGPLIYGSLAPSATFAVPMSSSTDQTFQIGTATGAVLDSTAVTGALTGGFRLTKTGNGVLVLGTTGTNTSTANQLGGLTINAGTVSISLDTALSTAPGSATAGYIVLDGGALRVTNTNGVTINANRGIALGDATAGSGGTINSATGVTTTYNGIIANNGLSANNLIKTGAGTLSLGGANTYTGTTTIDQGQITLNFNSAVAPATNIVSTGGLALGGNPTAAGESSSTTPTLLLQGRNAGSSSQTFGGTTLSLGNANVVVLSGTGASNTTLALGALTHAAGGTVGFSSINSGTGTQLITTSTANTNGILGGWATIATGTTGTAALAQTDWAINDGSGNIVALPLASYTTSTAGANQTTTTAAANNLLITSGSTGTVTLSATANVSSVNTILLRDTASRTINVASGTTVRLGSFGGIWRSDATAANTLTIGQTVGQGTLTAGGVANTPGEIVLNANGLTTTTAGIVVNTVVADNGTGGTVTLVKTGPVAANLAAANNTYTGGTFINQGRLTASTATGTAVTDPNNTSFGTGAVSISPGAQVSLAAGKYANNFNFAGTGLGGNNGAVLASNGTILNGTMTLTGDGRLGGGSSTAASTVTVNGKITGNYTLGLQEGNFVLTNSGNDFTGNLSLNGVTVGSTGTPNASSVTVTLGADNVIPDGTGKGIVVLGGSSNSARFSTLDMAGHSDTINGLASAGNSTVSSVSGLLGRQSVVTNSAITVSTLTIGNADQSTAFNGVITDNAVNGGVLNITKIGAGTLTLNNASTYAGQTTVQGGTLLLGASNTLSGAAGNVSVQGGRLASSVTPTTLGGNLQLTSGTVDPNGNNVGMLTLTANKSFTMSGGTLNLNLGTSFDQITEASGGTGSFTITGGTFALDVTGAGFSYAATYNVLSGFTGNSVSGLSFTGYDSATYTASLDNMGTLSFVAVPEPSSALMGGLVCVVGVYYGFRRKAGGAARSKGRV